MRDENCVNDSDARNKEATQEIFHYLFIPDPFSFSQCWNVPANNPKGIATSSPRLACNAYLGCAFGNGNNANGVVAEFRRAGGNGLAPIGRASCREGVQFSVVAGSLKKKTLG